jgi:hypothetical protein
MILFYVDVEDLPEVDSETERAIDQAFESGNTELAASLINAAIESHKIGL